MRPDLLEGVRTLQWSGLHSGITDTLVGNHAGRASARGEIDRFTGWKEFGHIEKRFPIDQDQLAALRALRRVFGADQVQVLSVEPRTCYCASFENDDGCGCGSAWNGRPSWPGALIAWSGRDRRDP
jgi:hypothetical protein